MTTEFQKKLDQLCKENWKVNKILIDCGGYDNVSDHVKTLINNEIENMEAK